MPGLKEAFHRSSIFTTCDFIDHFISNVTNSLLTPLLCGFLKESIM